MCGDANTVVKSASFGRDNKSSKIGLQTGHVSNESTTSSSPVQGNPLWSAPGVSPARSAATSVSHQVLQDADANDNDLENDPDVSEEEAPVAQIDGSPHWKKRIPNGTIVEDIITEYTNHHIGKQTSGLLDPMENEPQQICKGYTDEVRSRIFDLGIVRTSTKELEGYLSN